MKLFGQGIARMFPPAQAFTLELNGDELVAIRACLKTKISALNYQLRRGKCSHEQNRLRTYCHLIYARTEQMKRAPGRPRWPKIESYPIATAKA